MNASEFVDLLESMRFKPEEVEPFNERLREKGVMDSGRFGLRHGDHGGVVRRPKRHSGGGRGLRPGGWGKDETYEEYLDRVRSFRASKSGRGGTDPDRESRDDRDYYSNYTGRDKDRARMHKERMREALSVSGLSDEMEIMAGEEDQVDGPMTSIVNGDFQPVLEQEITEGGSENKVGGNKVEGFDGGSGVYVDPSMMRRKNRARRKDLLMSRTFDPGGND